MMRGMLAVAFLVVLSCLEARGGKCNLPAKTSGLSVYADDTGDSVFFECDKGYSMSGQDVLTCANGQWSGPAPTCSESSGVNDMTDDGWHGRRRPRYRNCRAPSTCCTPGLRRRFRRGSMMYWCDPGYYLPSGRRYYYRSCMARRRWSGYTPRCMVRGK